MFPEKSCDMMRHDEYEIYIDFTLRTLEFYIVMLFSEKYTV